MAKRDELIVGLDIGTTKICAVVGERTEEGLAIVGIGTHPSRGLKKGVVVDIDATVASIKKAVAEAEVMAGCEIASAYAGIAGSHIKGFNSHGVIAIKDREIKPADVKRVLEAARTVSIPPDREVIHVLAQEYIVDDQDGVREPVGMSGVRLEAKVHIVTGAVASAQNLIACANRSGLDVRDIVLQPLASGAAVLTPDERDLGVMLIDLGGGTTDLAIFCEGSVRHTASLPLGGNHVTRDIAVGLRAPFGAAEEVKIKYGCALASMVDPEETVEVPSVGGRRPRMLSRQVLCQIIEPRVEEIFTMVAREVGRTGAEEMLTAGAVLTGGSAMLEGMPELAEQILDMPVRVGTPIGVGGLSDVVRSPMYATGVGLVVYGSQQQAPRRFRSGEGLVVRRVWRRMREMVTEFFF
ncbi:MAG: cell division protein FtsA [Deltaproteobacteria bacterium]|nr:cell division protein FtsA [Deltaproteobacteria bacterium]MBI3078865.1 cell division protein FtsA [Deltaproteobacteria bacterium]